MKITPILAVLILTWVSAADVSLANPSQHSNQPAFEWKQWPEWKSWHQQVSQRTNDRKYARPGHRGRPHPPPQHDASPTSVPELGASGMGASAFLLLGMAAVATGRRRRRPADSRAPGSTP
jgi:hypothetical protein